MYGLKRMLKKSGKACPELVERGRLNFTPVQIGQPSPSGLNRTFSAACKSRTLQKSEISHML
jgi:hypothetical protein